MRGIEGSERIEGVESIATTGALSAKNPLFAFPFVDEAAFNTSPAFAAMSGGFPEEANTPVF